MNCKDYQRLLHLNRTGEISAREAEELRQHLRRCEKCTLEYRRIQRAGELVDRVASFTPTHKSPEKLTAAIMRSVRAESASPKHNDTVTQILDFFLQPAVRYGTVVAVLLIISTFMYQLMTTLDAIATVEQQMALISDQTSAVPHSTYTAESKTLEEVAKSKDVRSVAGALPVAVKGSQIEVSATTLESIAPIYDLRAVTVAIGSSALHIDKKTLEKIIGEVKATAESTLRAGREGA